ncbi:mitochondrial protein import protein ZIM17 protein [Dioscorea alata]|uniref:Mitochondrial protein import protein ZIM17 protein n=1 Tax=Dioscorea alata TaxID=55571 RepID=A0ACB7V859_DIOAL|nr:mitochondrial protein import protein ZIM17 protein [Dioscorea alata]
MAVARLLFRSHLASLLSHHRPQSQGLALPFQIRNVVRGIHETVNTADEDLNNPTTPHNDSNPPSTSVQMADTSSMKDPNVKFTAFSNLKPSARHDMAMVFTCKVCETRSVKTLCRESYEKGVVVARCEGCSNLHLIADRLGWFGEPGSVEDLLAAQGQDVRKGSIDTLNLTLEDLIGTTKSS